MLFGSTSAGFPPCESAGTVLRSLTEVQKGATFYLITLGMGVLAGAAVAANPNTAYLTGETGVFTLLALVILTWVLMRRPASRKEDHLVVQR